MSLDESQLRAESSKLKMFIGLASRQLHEAVMRGKWEMVAEAQNILHRAGGEPTPVPAASMEESDAD